MKRLFFSFVSILLGLSLFAQEQTFESGKFVYKLSGNNAVLVATAEDNLKDVRIPSSVKVNDVRYAVTAIADGAFSNQSELLSVSLGFNISSIGDNAFVGCSRLKAVYVYSLEPPKCSGRAPVFGSADGSLPEGLTVYVSAGSVNDFLNAQVWNSLNIEPMVTNF